MTNVKRVMSIRTVIVGISKNLKDTVESWGKKDNSFLHNVVRSGDYCKCGACRHEGYAYGIAHAKGVSHPFCQQCGVNSKLTVIDK
jgi:hypothetical protein